MNTATDTFYGTILVPCTDKWGGYVPQDALKTFLKKAAAVDALDFKVIGACNRKIKSKGWFRFNDRDAKHYAATYPDRYRIA